MNAFKREAIQHSRSHKPPTVSEDFVFAVLSKRSSNVISVLVRPQSRYAGYVALCHRRTLSIKK